MVSGHDFSDLIRGFEQEDRERKALARELTSVRHVMEFLVEKAPDERSAECVLEDALLGAGLVIEVAPKASFDGITRFLAVKVALPGASQGGGEIIHVIR